MNAHLDYFPMLGGRGGRSRTGCNTIGFTLTIFLITYIVCECNARDCVIQDFPDAQTSQDEMIVADGLTYQSKISQISQISKIYQIFQVSEKKRRK